MRKLLVVALFAPSVAFAATGSIDVQVSNAPGEIVLDGFPTDKRAPALLEQVPIGSHVVELEYGCMVGKAEVNVSEGAKAVVKLPLSNRGGEGTLRLRGTPFNAEVMVDGAPISKAEEGMRTWRDGVTKAEDNFQVYFVKYGLSIANAQSAPDRAARGRFVGEARRHLAIIERACKDYPNLKLRQGLTDEWFEQQHELLRELMRLP